MQEEKTRGDTRTRSVPLPFIASIRLIIGALFVDLNMLDLENIYSLLYKKKTHSSDHGIGI